MPNTTKSNRLKRKRGKKFVFHDKNKPADEAEAAQPNLFEEHSKSGKHAKDLERRAGLLEEYRKLGNNSSIIDNRIAEKSSKLSEDDKMKLRYIAEQRDRAMNHLNAKTSRKRERFNLDSDESDGGDVVLGGGGFTHRGKPMRLDDDFNEKIDESSDDERDPDKGKLTEEMVNTLNFGQGNMARTSNDEEHKKTRKEVFEEIIEKSKAYKEANKELKNINTELIKELDDDYVDLLGMLDFTRKKNNAPAESTDPKIKAADEKGKGFDSVAIMLREDLRKAAPVMKVATEHEKAAQRKKKIEEQLNTQANAKAGSDEESAPVRKRDGKLMDKREVAIEKAMKERASEGKDLRKAD